jgi:ABC-type Mn2+/Zn2+ transport system ATPase subunit
MKESRPLLELVDVSCGYRGSPVLRGVNLRIDPEQMWFLLGANGTGKSTLLKVMLGLLRPSAGELRTSRNRKRSARIGFVPQHAATNLSLPSTIREFVDLGFVGKGIRRAQRADTLTRCLETVGLTGRERDDLRTLSGGIRQRAVLARALVRDPNLLILDEPTNHLDATAENDFVELLTRLNRTRGMSVVFVTHDAPIAARLATHVALFRDGTVSAGPAAKILAEYEIERRLPSRTRTTKRRDFTGNDSP